MASWDMSRLFARFWTPPPASVLVVVDGAGLGVFLEQVDLALQQSLEMLRDVLDRQVAGTPMPVAEGRAALAALDQVMAEQLPLVTRQLRVLRATVAMAREAASTTGTQTQEGSGPRE